MPPEYEDLDDQSLSGRASARWRIWLARRRTLRNQQLLATGSGARMMSASLTTLDPGHAGLGFAGGERMTVVTCAPITVTEHAGLWRVDYGDGIERDYASEASALAAARVVSEREFRPVDKATERR